MKKYNNAVALDIIRQTKEQFYGLFCDLKEILTRIGYKQYGYRRLSRRHIFFRSLSSK